MSRKIVAAIRETRHASMDDVERALAELGEVNRADVVRGLEALLEPPQLGSDAYKLACAFFLGVVRACPDRALFAQLVRALPKATHPMARDAIVRALPLVNNMAEHGLLVAALRGADEGVRTAALRVLEKVVVATTLEMLASDFRSGPWYPAAAGVLAALVEKLGARATPAIGGAVSNGDARMVAAGFEAVVRAAALLPDKTPFLGAARARLRDGDDDIAAAAVACFTALVDDEDTFVEALLPVLELGGPKAVGAALKGIARFPSLRTLSLLEQRLMRGPSRLSLVALQVLQDIGSDDVLPPLVGAISHRRQRVRTEAVRVLRVLAGHGHVDMARAILFLLRSRDANVRRMASEVLTAMSERGAAIWPKLVAFIRDEDWWVRERLADALVPMAGAQLIPHVVPFLDDAAPSMRRFAVATLGRIGDGQALGALLIRARDDDDWLVREEAVRAIGAVGDARAVPYLVKLIEAPGLEIACLDALRKLKRADAKPLLPALLSRAERDVRMASLRYAQTIEANDHVDAIAALLADPDPEIARIAASTLRAWHYGGAADPALDEAGRLLAEMLRKVVKSDASDLLLIAGEPAFMKRAGRVERLTSRELTAENVYDLLSPLLLPEHVDALAKKIDVDFSHEDRRVGGRFRVNAFQGEGGLGAVFRVIKSEVVPLEKLGVPKAVEDLADVESGLVLFGGPPGSGKSTTLAGIIARINAQQSRHIISIEDPIEGVHHSAQSLVTQREIGVHTFGYHAALRAALREDPDVILVGELRDLETIAFAVTAAETGHLVFGTVHAVAADSCVERVINAFPHERQAQIRTMLSDTLKAIVCQHLVPRRDGGRVLACEIMLNSESIANLVRKGQAHQIASQMTLSRESGMCLMDDSLQALVDKGIVDVADAYVKARDKSRFPVPTEGNVVAREVPVSKPAAPKPIVAPTPDAKPIVAPTPAAKPIVAPTPAAKPIVVAPTPAAKPIVAPTPAAKPIVAPTPAAKPIVVPPQAKPAAAPRFDRVVPVKPVVPVAVAKPVPVAVPPAKPADIDGNDEDDALFESDELDDVPDVTSPLPIHEDEEGGGDTLQNETVSPSGVRPSMKPPRRKV